MADACDERSGRLDGLVDAARGTFDDIGWTAAEGEHVAPAGLEARA